MSGHEEPADNEAPDDEPLENEGLDDEERAYQAGQKLRDQEQDNADNDVAPEPAEDV